MGKSKTSSALEVLKRPFFCCKIQESQSTIHTRVPCAVHNLPCSFDNITTFHPKDQRQDLQTEESSSFEAQDGVGAENGEAMLTQRLNLLRQCLNTISIRPALPALPIPCRWLSRARRHPQGAPNFIIDPVDGSRSFSTENADRVVELDGGHETPKTSQCPSIRDVDEETNPLLLLNNVGIRNYGIVNRLGPPSGYEHGGSPLVMVDQPAASARWMQASSAEARPLLHDPSTQRSALVNKSTSSVRSMQASIAEARGIRDRVPTPEQIKNPVDCMLSLYACKSTVKGISDFQHLEGFLQTVLVHDHSKDLTSFSADLLCDNAKTTGRRRRLWRFAKSSKVCQLMYEPPKLGIELAVLMRFQLIELAECSTYVSLATQVCVTGLIPSADDPELVTKHEDDVWLSMAEEEMSSSASTKTAGSWHARPSPSALLHDGFAENVARLLKLHKLSFMLTPDAVGLAKYAVTHMSPELFVFIGNDLAGFRRRIALDSTGNHDKFLRNERFFLNIAHPTFAGWACCIPVYHSLHMLWFCILLEETSDETLKQKRTRHVHIE